MVDMSNGIPVMYKSVPHLSPITLMPTISVIIPTYGREDLLQRAVQSVCSQTFNDFELIIVNDCPRKDVSDILPADDRIKYIQHSKNRGAPAARNTGIQQSEGELIALLDDDDEWLEEKLEKQVQVFRELSDDYGLVYSDCIVKRRGREEKYESKNIEGRCFYELLVNNFIPSPTPLIRKNCFDNIGMFDTTLKSNQDLDMWLRISNNYKIKKVNTILAVRHEGHGDRISTNPQKKYMGTKQIISKYQPYISSKPEARANKYYKLGMYSGHLGRHLESMYYFYISFISSGYKYEVIAKSLFHNLPNKVRTRILNTSNIYD